MALVVRFLVAADAAAYRALMLEGYDRHRMEFTSTVEERAGQPLGWWETRIGSPDGEKCAFGAFDEDALVGAVALEFETREKTCHKATLIGMYVGEAARGQGAGRQLVQALLAHARSKPGVNIVLLTVTEGNAAAQRLYESCGFIPFGIEPRAVKNAGQYYGKVHLSCDLDALHAKSKSP